MKQLFDLHQYSKSSLVFIALWVLTMISLPIVGWTWGEATLIRGMSFGVLMQGVAVLAILVSAWGYKTTLRVFAIVGVLSYFAELTGSTTGIPFGRYHYTDVLQPQIAGVPLLIPLAWMMMLPPAWAMARIIGGRLQNRFAFILLSALAFTTWDLFLDPQMVRWGFWVWETQGIYFGIPLVNYLGWILVSALLTFAANPKEIPTQPLALVYVLTWFLQTIGQGLFWSQPGPAFFGFLGMGAFILMAFRKKVAGS